ncbi:uncharacterized protein LOC135371503 isoform X1 [Ornithodoros turicata]|uniref:uncharacterized protein LOC135371503 isoform X1 n=1 Tax=Ornithodoros turicata TaxID=34597 RepID=UPI0031395118
MSQLHPKKMIAFWYSVAFLACVDFGHVIFVSRRYSCHLGITGATMLMQIALLLACLFTWECVRNQNDQIAWNALQRDKGFFLMRRSVFYKDENKCVYLIKRRIISKRQKIEAHYGFWNGDHYSEEPCVMQAPPGGNGTVVYVSSPILGGEVLTFDVKYFHQMSGCLVLVGIDRKVSGQCMMWTPVEFANDTLADCEENYKTLNCTTEEEPYKDGMKEKGCCPLPVVYAS